jgi:hypothetical protein
LIEYATVKSWGALENKVRRAGSFCRRFEEEARVWDSRYAGRIGRTTSNSLVYSG